MLFEWVGIFAEFVLGVSLILAVIRLVKGPDVTDRVVALDLIATMRRGLAIREPSTLGKVTGKWVGKHPAVRHFTWNHRSVQSKNGAQIQLTGLDDLERILEQLNLLKKMFCI